MTDYYAIERSLTFFISISAYAILTITVIVGVKLVYDIIKEIFYDNRKSAN